MQRFLYTPKHAVLIAIMLFSTGSSAQEDAWDIYMAQYEKGPGSTLINLSLKQQAPVKGLPFALITGVKFKNCTEDGMPEKDEFPPLYKISDSVNAFVKGLSKFIHAGTFTHQCERLDYYYISDTTGIRAKLAALYAKQFPAYDPYINFRKDDKWDVYLQFLYPNDETMEYMLNQKVVMQLQQGGDKLEKERKVDHWIYFVTEKDQNCFVTYLTANKYTIESKEQTDDPKRKFRLLASKTDKVDLGSITRVTLELRRQAAKCNGDYDGWETLLIK